MLSTCNRSRKSIFLHRKRLHTRLASFRTLYEEMFAGSRFFGISQTNEEEMDCRCLLCLRGSCRVDPMVLGKDQIFGPRSGMHLNCGGTENAGKELNHMGAGMQIFCEKR